MLQHDFWSTVPRSSTIGVCSTSMDVIHLFCKTKVYESYVTIFVQKNVFRFKISINDIITVQTFYRQHYLSQIELRILFIQTCRFTNVSDQFSTRQMLKQKKELVLILESSMHSTAKVVVFKTLKNNLFINDMFNLFLILYFNLLKTF